MRRNTLTALAVAALGAITVPGTLTAQTPTPPRHERGAMMMRAGSPVDHIIEKRAELGLTDAQVSQLRDIGARLEEQNRPLRDQLEAARETMRAERSELTEEQRARMRERREGMTEEQRAQMRERRAALEDSIRQMTPEQRAEMRERMQQRRAEGDSAQRPRRVRPQQTLPDELEPVLEQLRANTESAMQQIRATLTPEQQEKLRELHPAMRRQRESGADSSPRAGRQRIQGARAPRGAR